MANYLIIGASSGIGKTLSENLGVANNVVYGTFYKNKIDTETPFVKYHYLNVLDEILDFDYLPNVLDAVVYCPGTINLKSFDKIVSESFVADFNLQVVGLIKTIQAVLPKLKNAEKPSIVLFSTLAVQTGLPFHSQVAVSKGAIEGLTKALAAEFAPKIRVNCIAPSLTDTPLTAVFLNNEQKRQANAEKHPLKRIGTTTDIANIVEFLISNKSSWITGQILHIDGGISTLKT